MAEQYTGTSLFRGAIHIKNHRRLGIGWRRPHHYRPTVLHRHALCLGLLTILWKRDLG